MMQEARFIVQNNFEDFADLVQKSNFLSFNINLFDNTASLKIKEHLSLLSTKK